MNNNQYKIVNRHKLFFIRIFDYIGLIIFRYISRFLHRPGSQKDFRDRKIQKILLIRLVYLGDIILSIAVLKPLRKHFPDAKIVFLTSPPAGDLLEGNPYLDEVMSLKPFWFYPREGLHGIKQYLKLLKTIRRERFDLAIDLRGDMRNILFLLHPSLARDKVSYGITGGGYLLTKDVTYSGRKHKIEFHLDLVRALGIDIRETDMWLPDCSGDANRIERLLTREGINKEDFLIAVHPGGRLPLKRWLPERYAQLADLAAEKYGAKIVITGDSGDLETGRAVISQMEFGAVSLVGEITLKEFVCILRRCRLVICNDSAPFHIALAVNTPAVGIFGPSDSRETGAWGDRQRGVEKDVPCRTTCDEHRCRNKNYHECMKKIQVEDVFARAKELIDINPLLENLTVGVLSKPNSRG